MSNSTNKFSANGREGLKEIKILMLGDPGVGKTSLINSLVTNRFEPNLPAQLGDTQIPADITPEKVTLRIVDYSERVQELKCLDLTIREADVVCVVFASSDNRSLERVVSHWIPTIRKQDSDHPDVSRPIVLVDNKVDLANDGKTVDNITEYVKDFKELDSFIEVSALTLKNVVELFYLAQKAVLFPISPLFDTKLKTLTPRCRNALIDVFELCDLDGDGLLDDYELNKFHETCFKVPLLEDAKNDLIAIIEQSTHDGILDDKITLAGFLFLHTLSIHKGRHAFTWRVLKKFNYDRDINKITDELKLEPHDPADVQQATNSRQDNSKHLYSRTSKVDSLSQLDLSWVRGNSGFIKTAVGFTAATLISMLALKMFRH